MPGERLQESRRPLAGPRAAGRNRNRRVTRTIIFSREKNLSCARGVHSCNIPFAINIQKDKSMWHPTPEDKSRAQTAHESCVSTTKSERIGDSAARAAPSEYAPHRVPPRTRACHSVTSPARHLISMDREPRSSHLHALLAAHLRFAASDAASQRGLHVFSSHSE